MKQIMRKSILISIILCLCYNRLTDASSNTNVDPINTECQIFGFHYEGKRPIPHAEDVSVSIRSVKLYYGNLDIETPNFDNWAVNDSSYAKGSMQITDVCRREANRILGKSKFDTKSYFNLRESTEMWFTIQKFYNPSFKLSDGACLWVSGSISSNNSYAKWYVDQVNYLIQVRHKYIPKLRGKYKVECVSNQHYIIYTKKYGRLDFFSASNRVYLWKTNEYVKPGLKWMLDRRVL